MREQGIAWYNQSLVFHVRFINFACDRGNIFSAAASGTSLKFEFSFLSTLGSLGYGSIRYFRLKYLVVDAEYLMMVPQYLTVEWN